MLPALFVMNVTIHRRYQLYFAVSIYGSRASCYSGLFSGRPTLSNPMHFLTTATATTSTPAPVSRKPDAAVDMATAATHHTVTAYANPSVPIPQAATPRDTGVNPMGSLTANAAAVSLSAPP